LNVLLCDSRPANRVSRRDRGQRPASLQRQQVVPITQQRIANTLGLSIVHTNKTLKKLSERGLIRRQERGCDVLKIEGLTALVEWEGLDPGAGRLI
jgi:CRP-like cAMP-binding protein